MTKTPAMERVDGGPDQYACDNCENIWPYDRLEAIADLTERIEAGGVVPAGECPVCGALCYPVRPPA
jgi:hypothetical protein